MKGRCVQIDSYRTNLHVDGSDVKMQLHRGDSDTYVNYYQRFSYDGVAKRLDEIVAATKEEH